MVVAKDWNTLFFSFHFSLKYSSIKTQVKTKLKMTPTNSKERDMFEEIFI